MIRHSVFYAVLKDDVQSCLTWITRCFLIGPDVIKGERRFKMCLGRSVVFRDGTRKGKRFNPMEEVGLWRHVSVEGSFRRV